MIVRRTLTAAAAALITGAALLTAPSTAPAAPRSTGRAQSAVSVSLLGKTPLIDTAKLTNLAHLDYLTATVSPPRLPGHTTYRLARNPGVGVLWVYANHLPTGGFQRTGGGNYDAGTNTYTQGAYDADDISRDAVVYLRHWKAAADRHSRTEAYELLRGLTYMQTATGPNAGNVVLWMQPDGTLNPSPTVKETPDPSDSGASYWLARTIWALGEGYAAFRTADPSFATFLKSRLDLAITALNRQVLIRYGQYHLIDGLRLPAWLIVDGADASAEAVLGLAAYVRAGGGHSARLALSELATGIAKMGQGNAKTWPYGAILPWALSRSDWHAWAAQMPSALAVAATALHQPRLLRPAIADAAVFTPHLLTATGPDNGWLPAPVDGSQIAYGADARVQGLLAVSRAAHSIGLRQVAGIAAGWFFGQNPAGVPTYDPSTGVTDDGVSPEGTVNLNSGAESTIHGLLTMEALDANPDVAVLARASASITRRDGQRTLEAEAATLSGQATVVTPNSAWTGESQWSNGAYVQVGAPSRLTWTVPTSTQPRLVQAVINRVPGTAATTRFTAAGRSLGVVHFGGGGAQGDSGAPGALLPITVARHLPAAASTLTAMTATTSMGTGQLDALFVTPLLSSLVTTGAGHSVALVNSVAGRQRALALSLPGTGLTIANSYDTHGRVSAVEVSWSTQITVRVPAGGFAVVLR